MVLKVRGALDCEACGARRDQERIEVEGPLSVTDMTLRIAILAKSGGTSETRGRFPKQLWFCQAGKDSRLRRSLSPIRNEKRLKKMVK